MPRLAALALFAVGCLSTFAACSAHAAGPSRPNVILIMADDLGYETIGVNGGTSYQTPQLDRLAAGGVRFTHGYVQPLCTPTRVQLMTGQYNIRNYIEFGYMNPQLKTFGNVFRDAGYATCITGKWQLGHDVDLPNKFGFDESCLWQHTRRPPRYKNAGLEINGKEVDYTGGEYGPDKINEYALDFITRHKDKPFFLYYPMILTHDPYEPTPDSADYASFQRKGNKEGPMPKHKDKVTPYFRDMVQYTDKLVGKLVARLDELGIRDNTLVIFIGDNGTALGTYSMLDGKPFIGGKGKMTDAGMHVPLIASWPGKLAKGKVCDDLVDSTDFLPTICAAAGITVPAAMKVDGRSFFPQLLGQPGSPREWYYSWYQPRGKFVGEFAATAKYKLYRSGKFYDLGKDIDEQSPLEVSSLTGEAAAAAKLLAGALDQFKDARPAALDKAAAKMSKKTGGE